MPHFCECGADKYICQSCGQIKCSKDHPPKWVETKYWLDNAGKERPIKGNVCPACMGS